MHVTKMIQPPLFTTYRVFIVHRLHYACKFMCKINKNGTWNKGEQKVMTKNKNLLFHQ
jgi:hypothetical protein